MSVEVDEGNSASTDVAPNQLHYATKRVSFGEKQVKTFVYEQQEPESSSASLRRQPFTRQDEPPSKVTVTSERSEIPSAILPPSVVEQTVSAPEDYHPSTGQARRLSGIITTPLPSLVSKMENEHENPFRPDDELYHQVDPIVEAYKRKPYGDFPSPVKTPPPAPSTAATNGKSAKDSKKDKKDKKRASVDAAKPKDIQYADATDGLVSDQAKRGTLNSPKAGKAELVHLEETKKRKCGCCVVQ